MYDDNAPNTKITIEQDGNDVIIRMPINLLVWTQKWREFEPYIILDTKKMVESMKEHLLDFQRDSYSDGSNFELFIDQFFSEMYEWAEDWIGAGWDEDEEKKFYHENNSNR